MSRSRVRAGISAGGQFAASARGETGVTLSLGAVSASPRTSIRMVDEALNRASQRLSTDDTPKGRRHVQELAAYGAALLVDRDYPDARSLDLGYGGSHDQVVAVGVRDQHGNDMAALTDEQKHALYRFTSVLRVDGDLVSNKDVVDGPAWCEMDLTKALGRGDLR